MSCLFCDQADRAEVTLSDAAEAAYDAVMADIDRIRAEHPDHESEA